MRGTTAAGVPRGVRARGGGAGARREGRRSWRWGTSAGCTRRRRGEGRCCGEPGAAASSGPSPAEAAAESARLRREKARLLGGARHRAHGRARPGGGRPVEFGPLRCASRCPADPRRVPRVGPCPSAGASRPAIEARGPEGRGLPGAARRPPPGPRQGRGRGRPARAPRVRGSAGPGANHRRPARPPHRPGPDRARGGGARTCVRPGDPTCARDRGMDDARDRSHGPDRARGPRDGVPETAPRPGPDPPCGRRRPRRPRTLPDGPGRGGVTPQIGRGGSCPDDAPAGAPTAASMPPGPRRGASRSPGPRAWTTPTAAARRRNTTHRRSYGRSWVTGRDQAAR